DGAGAAAQRTGRLTFLLALALATALTSASASATGAAGLGLPAVLAALFLAALMTHISRRKIGGQTGDVAGAAQQLAEIAFLLALVAGP
ncbi:MAG TPA: adenosylcobinamide-GDP ribazoletransferase, partial [Hyphomonas sp.]|nr:adenosylcobinamide-GDP ribazoletransferase [Hyphomonas sp.]